MPRSVLLSALLLACAAPQPAAAPPHPTPSPSSNPNLNPHPGTPSSPYVCTEVIGLTITAEWYSAGFEQLVPDAHFQARTKPHTFVDQWADFANAAWSDPITSPCAEHAETPDRVVLFAANWKLTSQSEWEQVLTAFVATAQRRYPALRDIQLFTVLRGPKNETCGDPKSVVDPLIDAAIATVASQQPTVLHAGPQLEAADCSVFDKGGPHFTAEGRKLVAQQLADVLR